jgi:hypothetical protein
MSSMRRRIERSARAGRPTPRPGHVTALLVLEASSIEELEELHRLIQEVHGRHCAECRGASVSDSDLCVEERRW